MLNQHTDRGRLDTGLNRFGAPRRAEDRAARPGPNDGRADNGGRADDGNASGGPEVRVRGGGRNGGRKRKKKKTSKAKLTIATLNMRGYGPATAGSSTSDKWLLINQIVREKRIAVLALQETHLSPERLDALKVLFGATLLIFNSADPERAGGARGVAFVVNKRMVAVEAVTAEEVLAGRAMVLKIARGQNDNLLIANVYAPNDGGDNADLWRELAREWARGGSAWRARPHILLGDFNVVEDAIDRLPSREDDAEAVYALRDLRDSLDLLDGWRQENEGTRAYTFLQTATGSQSRLDRIYVQQGMVSRTVDWDIVEPGIHTDHKLVMCGVTNARTPHVGKGRWSLPRTLVNDRSFLLAVRDCGITLQERLLCGGQPQDLWAAFKRDVAAMAKKRAKEKVPRLERMLEALRTDLHSTLQDEQAEGSERRCDRVQHAAILQDRIARLEIDRFGYARSGVAARDWLEGERIGKYWCRLNAPPKPDVVMYELRKEGGREREYVNKSDDMAEVAAAFYEGLQADDYDGMTGAQVEATTRDALRPMDARLDDGQRSLLDGRIAVVEVDQALVASANGKAPGLDGLPAELWKECRKLCKRDTAKGRSAFDIVKVLTAVYNDIEANGVRQGSDFTKGWVCPIYKKKDKREIGNYRPITVLNVDYKVMTKTLAARLAASVPSIIHPDQAGFIAGRQIFDHVKLAKLMIDLAEAEEANGVIVALDQEKAYDRVDHGYLWATLEHVGCPPSLIRTMKALYEGAESVVIVNGVVSRAFRVTRGVRQGDPMSCLLFDVAIEPLACAIRKSELRGMYIPGEAERLITTLFADDTTVYLDEKDSYRDLEGILGNWCRAARAKFNLGKTEIIPVGSPEYRRNVVESRRMGTGADAFPDGVHVAVEGEAVRMLGAWIGNGVDGAHQWAQMLDTIGDSLKRWGRRNPSLNGRKLAVGLEVGSRTQYLARVQTMPGHVEDALRKMIAKFVWKGDEHPRVGMDTLTQPIEYGGIGLLDVAARNEAIDLVWVREYLKLTPGRAKWARVADALFARAAASTSRNVEMAARVNRFTQTWEVSTRKKAGLPGDLVRLVCAAKKHGVRLISPNPTEQVKLALPIWYHIGDGPGRSTANTAAARCLRENHKVGTVGECQLAARVGPAYREARCRAANCACHDCRAERASSNCTNPARCVETARKALAKLMAKWAPGGAPKDGLSLTKRRLSRNRTAAEEGGRVLFDPSVADGPVLASCFRIFVSKGDAGLAEALPAIRPGGRFQVEAEDTEVHVAAAEVLHDSGDRTTGCAVWFGSQDLRNVALGTDPTQDAMYSLWVAVAWAVASVPPFAPLHLVSGSPQVVRGLTERLEAWEDVGWLGVSCEAVIKGVVAKLRARSAPTTLRLVDDDDGDDGGMVHATRAAQEAAAGVPPRDGAELPPGGAVRFLRKGARLATLSQSCAYRSILKKVRDKGKVERESTNRAVRLVQTAFAERLKSPIRAATLWRGLGGRDVPRRTRDFLWKCIHNAYRLGSYWEHIPECSERSLCKVCGVTETMEHILLTCTADYVGAAWGKLHGTMREKGVVLPVISYGLVLGSQSLVLGRVGGKQPPGADRIARILLAETVQLIWGLRCRWVIEKGRELGELPTMAETGRKWDAAICRRADMDWSLTARRFGKKALPVKHVRDTWEGVQLVSERRRVGTQDMPGVLVGRLTPEPVHDDQRRVPRDEG